MELAVPQDTDICTFCTKFWKEGDAIPWEIPMNGFERDITQMQESATAGCHCCAIFLSCTNLLEPDREEVGLGNNNDNRVFVLCSEDMLALCFLHSHFVRTPLRFVLKKEEGKLVW